MSVTPQFAPEQEHTHPFAADVVLEWASLGSSKTNFGLFRDAEPDDSRRVLVEVSCPNPGKPFPARIAIGSTSRYSITEAGNRDNYYLLVTTPDNWDKAAFEYQFESEGGMLRFCDWREYRWHVFGGSRGERVMTTTSGLTVFRSKPVSLSNPAQESDIPTAPGSVAPIDVVTVPAASEPCHDLLLMIGLDFVLQLARASKASRSSAAMARCA